MKKRKAPTKPGRLRRPPKTPARKPAKGKGTGKKPAGKVAKLPARGQPRPARKKPARLKERQPVPALKPEPGKAWGRVSKAVEKLIAAELGKAGVKNPILRRAAGKGPAGLVQAVDRVRSVAQARQKQLAAAEAAARVTRRDRGKLVIFDTQGRRYKSMLTVPKGRKIYAYKMDSIGRRRWLNPVDPSSVGPGTGGGERQPLSLRAFNWQNFQKIAPREYGETIQKIGDRVSKWPFRDQVFRVKGGAAALDNLGDSLAKVFTQAAKSELEQTQWVAEMLVKVKGVREPLRLTSQILRSGQFFDLEPRTRKLVSRFRNSSKALRQVVEYQTRDLIRSELAKRGLVSQGSARRIGRLSANRGRPRSQWVTAEGRAWHGREREIAPVESSQYRLRRVF